MSSNSRPSSYQDIHALYTSHRDWLLNWLRKRLSGSDEAPDLVQDTFVNVIKSGVAGSIVEPKPFLATVARRLIAQRNRHRLLETAYLEYLAEISVDYAPSAEDLHTATVLLRDIDTALDGLKPRVREVFLLIHLEGLSYSDTARRLRVSISTVKQHLAQANQLFFLTLTT